MLNPSSAFKVLMLGKSSDPLGGEDGRNAYIPDEIVGGDPEEKTQILKGEDFHFF
jgi:hypothetical protein